MSSFNILPKMYYKTNNDISFLSKGKSKEVCGLSCISDSTKREKKTEKKARKEEEEEKNACMMNFNPRQGNYIQTRNLNFTYPYEDLPQRDKNIHNKNKGYLVVLQQNLDQTGKLSFHNFHQLEYNLKAVSYTHLTLPTKLEV